MKYRAALCIFLLLATGSLNAQLSKQYHPFTGTMVFGLEGGATYSQTDYKTAVADYSARGGLEYFYPFYSNSVFGFRLLGSSGYIKGKDEVPAHEFRTTFTAAGAQVMYALGLGKVVFPYFSAGAEYTWFTPKDENGASIFEKTGSKATRTELLYSAELGMRFVLSQNISFNIGGAAHFSPDDDIDGRVSGNNNDMYYTGFAGFSVAFFTRYDSDGDGVDDDKDMCPDTPPGVKVDEFGCPIDSDHDGVPDYLDKCPGTPQGVKVDQNGCPVDSDHDGVPDYLDICPDTPRGVAVDEFGCPKDSDGDGVPDYLDQCPNTPKGVAVDKKGCPIDSDGDGVPDYLDQCPGTPAGTEVDEHGCPKKTETAKPIELPKFDETPAPKIEKQLVLSAGASFAPGRSELQKGAFPDLDKLLGYMKENPSSKWIIEGHTDSRGSYEANKKLSLERAQAVYKYFVTRGISKSRLVVRGLGPDYPVADNGTEAGRTKNRRVVINRVE